MASEIGRFSPDFFIALLKRNKINAMILTKGTRMSDKKAITNDWRKVGDDMRVAFGMKKSGLSFSLDAMTATMQGIRTINVCGTRIKNR